jgi:hypothetical protein
MKSLFFYNDNVYVVLRKINLSYIIDRHGNTNEELLKMWKEYEGADHVLKTNTHFLLCETVKEPEWVEVVEEEQVNS